MILSDESNAFGDRGEMISFLECISAPPLGEIRANDTLGMPLSANGVESDE